MWSLKLIWSINDRHKWIQLVTRATRFKSMPSVSTNKLTAQNVSIKNLSTIKNIYNFKTLQTILTTSILVVCKLVNLSIKIWPQSFHRIFYGKFITVTANQCSVAKSAMLKYYNYKWPYIHNLTLNMTSQ